MVRGGRGRGDCCGVLSLMFSSFGLLLLNIAAVAFLCWTHWRSTGMIMQLLHWQIIHFIGWEDGACGFLILHTHFFNFIYYPVTWAATHRLRRISLGTLGYFHPSFCFPDCAFSLVLFPRSSSNTDHAGQDQITRHTELFAFCSVCCENKSIRVLPFRVLTPTHDVKLLVSSQRYSAVKPLNVKTRLVSTHAYARRHTRTRTTPKRTRRSAKATGTNIKCSAV